MKIILSPAKKMITDTDSIAPVTLPEFIDKTTEILNWLKDRSKEELKAIWKCNDKILEQNFNRLENMNLYQMLTPAVLSYEGIAFQYMAPSVFEDMQFEYVQNHLRILSAFYGVLKPMDGVTPYRLEMQAKVGIGDAKNLYEYWGDLLYRSVIDDSRIIINLASKEYSKCIEKYLIPQDRYITVTFCELSGDKLVTKGTYAKMARGEMVRFIAENNIENPVEIQPLEFAGETAVSKITRIRKALRGVHADGMLVSALDDIAWTLNLRGTDVHCNPVFVSYLLIASDKVSLFVDEAKLADEVRAYLQEAGISVYNYNKVEEGLKQYAEYNILLDGNETSYHLWKTVKCQEIISQNSPIPSMKAVKSEAEIAGYRRAMVRDGVAMVKFLKWLIPAVEAGGETEISIDRKLTALRAEQDLFRDISFDTIAGYQEHGAIVHYEASPETDIPLKPEGLLLLDSGAQYQDATTDITRTIALGPVTDEMKHIYTLVLKGHIQLELAKFPDGASGTQLDALARECMWREGLNFLHGTGHGVGSYLNVHEGPHQVRMEYMPAPLRAGMTLTDEPGLYLAGKFGVRIENTILIQDYKETEFGKFLQIESLTLCPIDTTPIDVEMLLPEEIAWLNDYHAEVYARLAPHLDEEEKKWLKNATKAIK